MIRYKMFEKEITSGNHVSYHFCVDKFADNFHPKSRQHDIEKQLRYVHIDLSPYELGITSSNTTSDGDYIHVSYLRRLNNGFMRQEVLDYFNIKADFPVLYFTRKVPFESNYKCGFYLGAFKKFNSVFFDETDTAQPSLVAGAEITLNVYPEGASSGDTYYTGSAIVTGRTINSSFDGMVEMEISYQGTGALTEQTV